MDHEILARFYDERKNKMDDLLLDFYQAFLGIDTSDRDRIIELNAQYREWVRKNFKKRYKTMLYYSIEDIFDQIYLYDCPVYDGVEISGTILEKIVENFSQEEIEDILEYTVCGIEHENVMSEAIYNEVKDKVQDIYYMTQLKLECDKEGVEAHWERV